MRRCNRELNAMLGDNRDNYMRPNLARLPQLGEYKWKKHDGFPYTVYLTRDDGVHYAMWATCHKTGRLAVGFCHMHDIPGWWLSKMNEQMEIVALATQYKLKGELR